MSATLAAHAQCFNTIEELNTNQLYFFESVRDPYGNTYAVASFRGTITIGHLTFQGIGTTQFSLLVMKFDKNNNPVWGFAADGESNVYGKHIELDNNNDIVIGGSFSGPSLDFGCKTIYNSGRWGMFVAKINKHGEFVWVIESKGPGDRYTTALSVAPDNSIILTGTFVAPNELSFGNKTTQGIGGYDMFIAKFSGEGMPLWIRSFGGASSYDYVYDVEINTLGEAFITGNFTGKSIDFDGTVFEPGNPSQNYFLAKLDQDGQVKWAKTTDQNCVALGYNLALDEQENVYATGRYYNTAAIEGKSISAVGSADIFLFKYNGEGQNSWLRSVGGSGFDNGYKLASGNGKLSLSAYYYSSDFFIGSTEVINSSGDSNAFIADFDTDGQFGCVINYDLGYETYINDLEYDSLNNISIVKEINYLTSTTLELLTNDTTWLREPDMPGVLDFNLGEDLLLCDGETRMLHINVPCDGSIEWQDGTSADSMLIDHPGIYWAKVTKDSDSAADTIAVTYMDHFKPLASLDTMVCAETEVQFNITDPVADTYYWSTGQSNPTVSIRQSGEFWVERQNQCYTIRDTFNIAHVPPMQVELGKDTVMCAPAEPFVLNAAVPGATSYLWSTGDTTPEIAVTATGQYSVQVFNECEVKRDTINVRFIPAKVSFLPNIITPNGDALNDTFILPENMLPSEIMIMNRWGKQVYYSNEYNNTWQAEGLTEGVYFYQVQGGKCASQTISGAIHVMK
ncbi:hypothetical protein GCM10009122_37740 [Fulvivirga kasyanovii]